jgi:hypothetical protein
MTEAVLVVVDQACSGEPPPGSRGAAEAASDVVAGGDWTSSLLGATF